MNPLPIDALIMGGGATGLWLRALLKSHGRSVILIESSSLGSGQTIASQGIIHSGAKYAGRPDASRLVAALQKAAACWKQHLAGKGFPDLRRVEVITSETWFWHPSLPLPPSLANWCDETGANDRRDESHRIPGVLRTCQTACRNRMERSVCVVSLLNVLAGNDRSDLLQLPDDHIRWDASAPGEVSTVTLRHPARDETLTLRPGHIFLAAGAGNPRLREALGLSTRDVAQQRPLRMAMVRGPLPRLCGHWFDDDGPRLTISTQFDQKHGSIWQLGGRIAEGPTCRSTRAFLKSAREELLAALPGLDLSPTEWASYEAVRAEPKSADGGLPANAVILREGSVTTLWPTKLTLLPTLMARVRQQLDAAGERPPAAPVKLTDWPRPLIAQPPWETCEDWTSDAELSATG